MSLADDIRKLHELHQAGALTDEEFAKAKTNLLNGTSGVAERRDNGPPLQRPTQPAEKLPQRTDYAEDDFLVLQRTQPRPPLEKANNGLALTGFVLGLASIVFYFVGIIPILAVVFSVLGLCTFDNKKHKNPWMPAVGLALGAIYTLVMANHYGHFK